jgi:hypothetical protein
MHHLQTDESQAEHPRWVQYTSLLMPVRNTKPEESSLHTVIIIRDHLVLLNLTWSLNALSDAYFIELRSLVFLAAHDLGFADDALQEGVCA